MKIALHIILLIQFLHWIINFSGFLKIRPKLYLFNGFLMIGVLIYAEITWDHLLFSKLVLGNLIMAGIVIMFILKNSKILDSQKEKVSFLLKVPPLIFLMSLFLHKNNFIVVNQCIFVLLVFMAGILVVRFYKKERLLVRYVAYMATTSLCLVILDFFNLNYKFGFIVVNYFLMQILNYFLLEKLIESKTT